MKLKIPVYLNNVTINVSGPSSFDILEGHSKATMFLICNNAAQGILSSFFFKYAGERMILGAEIGDIFHLA